jgi:hypothetical protein
MDNKILNEIAGLLKESLIKQLNIKRPSTTYGGPGKPGLLKPVSKKYPTPVSKPIASGNLIRNIDVKFVNDNETGIPDLIVEMPIEGYFVSEGRRPSPGKYPPLGVIDRWSIVKPGMSGVRDEKGRFIPRKTLNFLRARSIAKYGFGGNDFIMKGFYSVQQQILELYGEEVAGFLQFQIDKFADKLRNE